MRQQGNLHHEHNVKTRTAPRLQVFLARPADAEWFVAAAGGWQMKAYTTCACHPVFGQRLRKRTASAFHLRGHLGARNRAGVRI